ncbi:hypothetical protein M011DRAFT_205748 [Sporormia fimetaria CBS 119925]|uniref:Transmembrane protein n=1 Tax=Sporormia fimetaria CBS 119925 TaxID=1340428 RepID=A0A6A6V3G3_9PLEO|nr:hypothetical protein M011DRAFT_205748 [Sporormia fimetaria CBS 119925]
MVKECGTDGREGRMCGLVRCDFDSMLILLFLLLDCFFGRSFGFLLLLLFFTSLRRSFLFWVLDGEVVSLVWFHDHCGSMFISWVKGFGHL